MQRAAITLQPDTSEALSAETFNAAMAASALPASTPLAVAVSGGPDSTALAFCLQRWISQQERVSPPPLAGGVRGGLVEQETPSPAKTKDLAEAKSKFLLPLPQGERKLYAFIVDHALRPESADEALQTKVRLESIGIKAEILTWQHEPVISKLHITARKARYKLLIAACKRHGIRDLFLAHQLEDQAETILMRFAKGSGIDGLAGIAPVTHSDDIRLLRPLLSFSKSRLIATCDAEKLPYVTDPSNQLDKYARGRLRRVMPLLAEEGLTPERLADLGMRAAEASYALDYYTNDFLKNAAEQDIAGTIRFNLAALKSVPRAIAGRAVTLALQTIHREDYAPEQASLNSLLDAALSATHMAPRTLHGCLVSMTATQLILMREYAAITDNILIHPGETILWDDRWQVTLSAEAVDNYNVRPLGNPPHDQLDILELSLRHLVPQGRARATLPALWHKDKLTLFPSLTTSGSATPAYAQILSSPVGIK